MRACEGCRRRKIKCDAATTNTWPCSACIRLKLHCVRPNGYDGSSADAQVYDMTVTATATATPATQSIFEAAPVQEGFRQQVPLQQMAAPPPRKPSVQSLYPPQSGYTDTTSLYSQAYADSTQGLHYTTVPPPIGVIDPSYSSQNVFSTPPLPGSQAESPESYGTDQFGQADIADLLGSLNVDEAGTGELVRRWCSSCLGGGVDRPALAPFLNNKMLARGGDDEEPDLEDDDDYNSSLPPLVAGPGHKIRIPPDLMLEDETALHYFQLYFANVHPYVPVLDRRLFYQQWQTSRESINPLLLEAIFAIGGRLADDPAQGQQWLALASSTSGPTIRLARELLTAFRTCRFLPGCAKTEYAPGAAHCVEGPRGSTQAWLLLPFLDGYYTMRPDGQRFGARRALRRPCGGEIVRVEPG